MELFQFTLPFLVVAKTLFVSQSCMTTLLSVLSLSGSLVALGEGSDPGPNSNTALCRASGRLR